MTVLLLAAPLFLIFEIWQLVLGERYLGLKRLAAGADPRTLPMSERLAFFWTASLTLYWLWMGLVLGGPTGRAQALALVVISVAGSALRRTVPLKWALVVLTFEGALRVGMLVSLTATAVRHLRGL